MITTSKVKNGTLSLATHTFACQATSVKLVPSSKSVSDAAETLCGDKLAAEFETEWTLDGTSFQDFEVVSGTLGFQHYLFENDLTTVAFSWSPSATSGTFSGTCVVHAAEFGGDVGNSRQSTSWSFEIVGKPTFTAPAGP